MLKRTMAVVLALVMAMTAGSVFAQSQCVIGVYADTEGTDGYYQPIVGQQFHVYVVMNLQDTIKAVSYTLEVPGLGTEIFMIGDPLWGPAGEGIAIPEVPQLWTSVDVGLGECVNGFTGFPVLIADYAFIFLGPAPPRTLTVGPYTDPLFPIYVDCFNEFKTCDIGPGLELGPPIANDSESWGAVKSLFGN